MIKNILVTGGAGYVGSALVPALIDQGYFVRVLDLMLYGDEVFKNVKNKERLEIVKGDIRDISLVEKSLREIHCVIHLACISNDPSFELNPELGKTINYDAFRPLVELSKQAGVERFIYASSSSVYGIKDTSDVVEEMSLEPLTDYSKFKAMCETVLVEYESRDFTTVTIRPATVCGYAPRQRLDVIVNILSNHAFHNRKVKVFGGKQLRPNLHVLDMVDVYLLMVKSSKEKISRKIYNVGYENHSVEDLAFTVRKIMGSDVTLEYVPTDDNRSYHISSKKIERELGFVPKHTIEDAVIGLKEAFENGLLTDTFKDQKFYNVQLMKAIDLK
jgi:nucleoside-diphosphate-sugar epimerase